MIKRILSVCMAASIFFCAVSFGAYASPASAVSNVMSEAQWDTYWETVKDDRSVMALTPGSSEDDQTQDVLQLLQPGPQQPCQDNQIC